eukprot:Sdes_comp20605_c0_seq1m15623
MQNIRHKILVLSGKGGVGKSTITSQLAFGLASKSNATHQIGVLDIDICGPSIPKIMGCEGEQVHHSGSGWSPIFVAENLAVMSIGFLLNSPEDAVIWRGPKKNGLIKQFLKDVDWGNLDYLIIDTPPGTSDEHISIAHYLKSAGVDGAVLVTTPQEVSLMDVRKEINFCRKVGIQIIGVVENMSRFVCPKCQNVSLIFPPTSGGAQKLCKDLNLNFLGSVPLESRVGKACDEGRSFVGDFSLNDSSSAALVAFRGIIDKISAFCDSSDNLH